MAEQILTGIRIIDLSRDLAGAVATQLLGEAGAEVLKIEPSGGDPLRGFAAFATWNRGKRSVVLDLDLPTDRARLEVLLRHADVLVHGMGPIEAAASRLSESELRAQYPDLVVCSVTGYPPSHPDADRRGHDLLVQARSGLMDEQIGWRDGPICLRFPGPSWAAAYLAAAGIVTRLDVRHRTGHVGPVHTSLLQGALTILSMFWNRAENPVPELFSTKYDVGPHAAMYRCSDGHWLQIMNPGGRKALSAFDFLQTTLASLGEPPGEIDAARMRRAFLAHSSNRWVEELRRADFAVELVAPIGDLLQRPEVIANNLVVEIDDPTWGPTRQAAAPFDTEPPSTIRSAAPLLGADTEAVFQEAPAERRARTRHSGEPPSYPLSGLRVVDVGAWFAGPVVPMLLADLGAEVIKVEPITGDPMRPMANFFAACSRGKRSIAVDLESPAGREVLQRLVEWADVVHHNVRAGASARFGIDEEGIRKANPDAVFSHVSAYGSCGSSRDRPGYDSVFQAMAGWEVANAGEGNEPLFSRLCTMDVLSGLASLVATLLAIYQRSTTGRGRTAKTSMLGVATFTQSETVLLVPTRTVAPYPTLDGMQTGLHPGYRIYEAVDGWIAIVALGSASMAALRRAAKVASDNAIADAIRAFMVDELIWQLDQAGVAAERVRVGAMHEFFDDERNVATGLVSTSDHPIFGRLTQPGAFWSFGDLKLRIDAASPTAGQHSSEILDEMGYSSTEIDLMVEQGAIGRS